MKLHEYIARRLLLLVLVLVGVSIFTFTLSHVVSNPVVAYITRENMPQAQIQAIIREHHFDDPLYLQYFYYLRDLSHGDLGVSRTESDRPVVDVIVDLFPATAELAIVAMFFSLALSIPLGVLAATRRDKLPDFLARLFSLSAYSLPYYLFAIMLQFGFFYLLKVNNLPYLPSGERVDYTLLQQYPVTRITGLLMLDSILQGNFIIFSDALKHILLPALTLSLASFAFLTMLIRSTMIEVLRQDYIIAARAKGLSDRIVIYKHALKNAMIPTVTAAGLAFGGLLGGAVITERIFSWPGIGNWAVNAILSNDIAAVMGVTLLAAILYVVVNLVVDILYAMLDPRVRLG